MDAIFLSGNSVSNRDWIIEIEKKFSKLFDKTYVQFYKHWETGNDTIDLTHELKVLINNLNKVGDEYIIFAKSIGTILTARAVREDMIKPQKCIFVGTPVKWAREKKMNPDSAFYDFDIPTLFIQHLIDPICSSEDLKKFLDIQKVKNYELVELPGDTHHYPEFDILKSLVNEFVFEK